MKVGILTFHFAYNYGAVLQAWGLRQAIESLGHEVCIINYVPEYMRKSISPFRGWGLRSGRQFTATLARRITEVRRRGAFNRFSDEHLNKSPYLKTRAQLKDFCEQLDAVVVGSDQLWNLSWLKQFDDTYFLGFLDEKSRCKKIAYAPCFGHSDLPATHLAKALPLIRRFDAIGMRNNFGLQVLEQAGGIKAELVVDPGFFIPTKPDVKKTPQTTIYAVANAGAEVCVQVARLASHQSQAPVVQLCSENGIRIPDDIKSLKAASPQQWLETISRSTFVCSESFHGAVFSLANKVPFVCASGQHRSLRVTDLLTQYDCTDRFLQESSDFRPEMLELDGSYYAKLQADIARSRDYLQNALKS